MKNETKFTPEPWKANCYPKIRIFGKDGEIIATVNAEGRGVNRNLSYEEHKANVDLITAAPNMLGALINLADMYEKLITDDDMVICNARDAISKALGE